MDQLLGRCQDLGFHFEFFEKPVGFKQRKVEMGTFSS